MLPGREFILARVDEVRGGAGEGGVQGNSQAWRVRMGGRAHCS